MSQAPFRFGERLKGIMRGRGFSMAERGERERRRDNRLEAESTWSARKIKANPGSKRQVEISGGRLSFFVNAVARFSMG